MPKARTRKRRTSKYSETEKLAYRLGQINKGLENPNSKVSQSFNNGSQNVCKNRKPKKTMF